MDLEAAEQVEAAGVASLSSKVKRRKLIVGIDDAQVEMVLSWLQALAHYICSYVYKHRAVWPTIQRLHEQGKLNATQELLFKKVKPIEELYDLENDPHEICNLADSPDYEQIKARLSDLLDEWIADTRDTAFGISSTIGITSFRRAAKSQSPRQRGLDLRFAVPLQLPR